MPHAFALPAYRNLPKKISEALATFKILLSLPTQKGFVAEWLGNGLQNRVQRFESARNLKKG